MDQYMRSAYEQAMISRSQGGIPIGAVLVIDGQIAARGHNQRVQKKSSILHAEMDCLERAGRLKASKYRHSTLYTTLSPCPMCSGAAILYKIPRIVIGENVNFLGAEETLRQNGIEIEVLNDLQCIEMMQDFIRTYPELWNEDIGI